MLQPHGTHHKLRSRGGGLIQRCDDSLHGVERLPLAHDHHAVGALIKLDDHRVWRRIVASTNPEVGWIAHLIDHVRHRGLNLRDASMLERDDLKLKVARGGRGIKRFEQRLYLREIFIGGRDHKRARAPVAHDRHPGRLIAASARAGGRSPGSEELLQRGGDLAGVGTLELDTAHREPRRFRAIRLRDDALDLLHLLRRGANHKEVARIIRGDLHLVAPCGVAPDDHRLHHALHAAGTGHLQRNDFDSRLLIPHCGVERSQKPLDLAKLLARSGHQEHVRPRVAHERRTRQRPHGRILPRRIEGTLQRPRGDRRLRVLKFKLPDRHSLTYGRLVQQPDEAIQDLERFRRRHNDQRCVRRVRRDLNRSRLDRPGCLPLRPVNREFQNALGLPAPGRAADQIPH